MDTALIPHQRFRMHFIANHAIPLPVYKGSAFRGLFGHALKRMVCPFRPSPCDTCLLAAECLYLTLFETPATGRTYRPGANRDPHPFLLVPPLNQERVLAKNMPFTCEITLMGKAIKAIPHIALACQEMGRIGLGRNNLTFRLELVESMDGEIERPLYHLQSGHLIPVVLSAKIPYPTQQTKPANSNHLWTIHTLTPLRITHQGQFLNTFAFAAFFRSLLFRLDDLARLYGSGPLPVDIPQLLSHANTVTVMKTTMQWSEYLRYSNRQGGTRKLGGIEGEAILAGDLTPLLPWLRLGESLHAGKGTSFGLGKYCLTELATDIPHPFY